MNLRLRYFKAYGTFMLVLFSYINLALKRKFFGKILGKAWGAEASQQAHRRAAQRMERTILDLKGLFIKVGQMLSIMTNFLPEAFTGGLEGLQDAVPPHPYEAIQKRFREEFQKDPLELFKSFEDQPIASASLGQVHVAYLHNGTKVAVKVQYPEIDEIVRVDLKMMRRIFGILNLFFPAYGLKNVYREIAEVVTRELDYKYEAQNLELIHKNFSQETDFLFPDVFWDYSSSKILTLRFMEGTKISDLQALGKQGIQGTDVAKKIIHAYCKQIFIDGVYHADPHPGNLLVLSQGLASPPPLAKPLEPPPQRAFKIIFVDFGATARISEKMRHGITVFAEGLIKRDTRVLANALREMGFVARPDSFEPFEQLVDYFYGKLSNIKVENFKNLNISQFQNIEDLLELRKIKISFKDLMTSFHVPQDWMLLERTLILMMGLCAHLDPKLNPIEIVLPYVETFVLKDKTFVEVIGLLTKEIALSYLQLPHEINKTLRKLNEGSLTIRSGNLLEHSRTLYTLGHQILYGLLGISSLFLSTYYQQNGLEKYADYLFYASVLFGVFLLGSFFKNR